MGASRPGEAGAGCAAMPGAAAGLAVGLVDDGPARTLVNGRASGSAGAFAAPGWAGRAPGEPLSALSRRDGWSNENSVRADAQRSARCTTTAWPESVFNRPDTPPRAV
ncbi:Uncharacterised protein [Bordetella pertussis]|nr:Uncharacterised protein [Bordetella pertussis]